jgi:predicted TIM-barrel fold metal-dependent hydrolase
MATLAGVPADPVVRLEAIAERLAIGGVAPERYGDAFREALEDSFARGAIATKTILAYRGGFDRVLDRPADAEVVKAAARWIRGIDSAGPRERTARLDDDVLLRFGIWAAVDTGRPLQVHTGFGDPDLDLHRADPLLLTDFLRATIERCEILLLHTYPFHRNAGYLAQMFPHVSIDVGLAVNYAGARATDVIAESLELAPFTKVLFSSDAWGVPELHLLGAVLFRRGMSRVLGGWVAAGDWTLEDALHVVDLIAGDNARRIYGVR